jgi:hypothetical protein
MTERVAAEARAERIPETLPVREAFLAVAAEKAVQPVHPIARSTAKVVKRWHSEK